MNRRLELTVGTVWAALSLAAMIAGSLGPWVTVGPFSVNGTAGDGMIALVAGIVAAIAVAVPRIPVLVALAAATVAAGVAVYDLAAIVATDDTLFGSVVPGWGIVAVLVGGVSLAVWALLKANPGPRWARPVISAVVLLLVAGAGVAGALNGSADTPEETEERTAAADDEAEEATEPEAQRAAPPQVGDIGATLTLTTQDGVKVGVTLERVRDPLPGGEYDSVPNRKRMVGVELRLTNDSADGTYEDSPSNGAKLIFGEDLQADSAAPFGECQAPSVTIGPSDSRKLCIPFEVGADDPLEKFQLALDSGFGPDRAEWLLPNERDAAESADTPRAAGERGMPSAGSLTKCDQNISAGPNTSCGFADEVFVEYARLLQAGDVDGTVALRATSPATERTYSMTCEVEEGENVHCRGGEGAYVRFPRWAAEVY